MNYLLDLKEGKDVFRKKALLLLLLVVLDGCVPVVHLKYIDHPVTFVQGLVQLWCTPCANEGSRLGFAGAGRLALLLCAFTTQGELELPATSPGENGVI